MTTNKKAAQAANRAASSAASFSADHSTPTLPRWLVSLPMTAGCIASLGAPIVAVVAGLIEGGAR